MGDKCFITRDQRMMFAVITMVIIADNKKQLNGDTETVLSVARKHMCQLALLKFQQFDGLNTVLPIGMRKTNTFRTLTTKSLPCKLKEAEYLRQPNGWRFECLRKVQAFVFAASH